MLALSVILKFEIKYMKFMCVYMLPLAGRVRTLCNLRLQRLPYERENDFSLEYLSDRNLS